MSKFGLAILLLFYQLITFNLESTILTKESIPQSHCKIQYTDLARNGDESGAYEAILLKKKIDEIIIK